MNNHTKTLSILTAATVITKTRFTGMAVGPLAAVTPPPKWPANSKIRRLERRIPTLSMNRERDVSAGFGPDAVWP